MQDRFLIGKIFKGNELAYGVFKPSNEKDVRGKEQGGQGWGYTEQLSTDTKVWQAHLDGEESIGAVPIDHDNNCHWGCIDIDEYPIDIKKILKNFVLKKKLISLIKFFLTETVIEENLLH